MQEQEAQHRATMSAQATDPRSSTEAKTTHPKTSNAPQKGIHRGSRRQVKHEKGWRKNATGEPAVVTPVEPGLTSEVKHMIQEDAPKTVVAGLEGIQPALNSSQAKKPKPRPSKAERAKRRAAKALEAEEQLTPQDGLAKETTVTKEPTLGAAPSTAFSTQNSSAKKPQSKAVQSKRAPVRASASASVSNPTHKPPPEATHTNALARKTAWMFKETTGTPVCTISPSSLVPHTTQVSSAAGFSTLCSYNWQHDGSIYVPGSPPKWTPPTLPTTLAQDSGRHFIDQNASWVPKYPFEPAFRALSLMNAQNTSLNDVDIIANRNSLRKLLDFCAGKRLDPFCMGLHMIGNTLVISRKERSAQYMIHGAPNAGYGHSFERSFTTPDNGMDNSSSHHRVIRYRMGSLDCVVRFEVDAYYDGDGDAASEACPGDTTDALADAMAYLTVADTKPAQASRKSNPANKPTTAIQKGTFTPPAKLAEIKAKRAGRLADAMPQLWFGRTPYFINGNHNNGTVHSVSVAHAEAEFEKWEEANQEKLRNMVGLLEEIKGVVGGLREGKGVLVCDVKGAGIKVYEGRGGGVLPGDVISKYWTVGPQ